MATTVVRTGNGGIDRFKLAAAIRLPRLRQRQAPAKARAWVEIDLDRLAHNLGQLRSVAPCGTEIMAVVKANAYGHGSFRVAKRLYEERVRSFAVAEVDEAIELRRRGIRGEVLVLGYTPTHRLMDIVRYDLTQTAVDADDAERLQAYGAPLKIQVKIDTGMRRLGESFERPERILSMYRHERLFVTGTYSHLASADRPESEAAFTRLQFRRFEEAVSRIREAGFDPGRLHIQSSYGLLNHDCAGMDTIRAGIALYGLLSREEDKTRKAVELLPVLSLKTTVILVKQVREGERSGYGGAFEAERDSVIATLSIGYADGIARELSERGGCVLIRGRKVRIVGVVCMDQMLVDVTDVEGVSQGDTATLIGEDGCRELTAGEMARRGGTISNEIVSSIGNRVERIYVANSTLKILPVSADKNKKRLTRRAMRIETGISNFKLSLFNGTANRELRAIAGTLSDFKRPDKVELGSIPARELPEGEIKHHVARRILGGEVDAALDRVLGVKPPEVADAAYRIIGSNLFADSIDLSEEERAELLESGLAQAKYLADNYMSEEEGQAFLETIRLLAGVAKTGKADIAEGRIVYDELPQRPVGAPEDYVSSSELMKRYDPSGYAAMKEAIAGGNMEGGLSKLLQFVRNSQPQLREWTEAFVKERNEKLDGLRNAVIGNRFEGADTASGLSAFLAGMNERFGSSVNSGLLQRNLQAFASLLI